MPPRSIGRRVGLQIIFHGGAGSLKGPMLSRHFQTDDTDGTAALEKATALQESQPLHPPTTTATSRGVFCLPGQQASILVSHGAKQSDGSGGGGGDEGKSRHTPEYWTIPHPLTVGLVSASPRQTHAPQLWGIGTPAPRRNGKTWGAGEQAVPGLWSRDARLDVTSFKTRISALRCAFPPSSTARPPPFLACSPTNQQSQDPPRGTHHHYWLFVYSCPSSGSIPELRLLTHSMPRTAGFVWSPGLSTWLLASPSLTYTHTHKCLLHAPRGEGPTSQQVLSNCRS
ncbi:hypothetical protein B0T18DRAFT_418098 [Schizothecium vesticola]|uniref:Uncharacterized protein n=1 Tax=Schizothecium vesticola TaxID=314040 RepID=A0AA40EJH7_9PEZI|nr:hypothetical protein B0T18DRAFT_418098 [Schizothecium vesticola]